MSNFIDSDALKELMDLITEHGSQLNLHIHLYPESQVIIDPVDPPVEEKPPTIVVAMTAKDAFKAIDYYNDSGFPVMKNVQVGWRAETGERFEVEADFIMGNGGVRFWKLWQGPSQIPDADQLAVRGYFITKSDTIKV